MILKNRNIFSKIRRSKVTDYAALIRPFLLPDIRDIFSDLGSGGMKKKKSFKNEQSMTGQFQSPFN